MAAMTARGVGCSASREWVREAVLLFVNGRALARALDRDELIAGAAFAGTGVGRDRAGDLFLADLAVGCGLGEFPRLAVGRCRCRAALGARRQATVDAVAVGIVGDDEYTFFGLRGRRAEQQGEGDRGEEGSHGSVRGSWTGIGPADQEPCEGNVKAALTQYPSQKRRRVRANLGTMTANRAAARLL